MTPERLPEQPAHTQRTDADGRAELIRREERLVLTTEVHATERIHVERVVVTEQQTITVDVRREELRITREAIPAAASLAVGSQPVSPEPVVMILHEERVEVVTSIVPVERITLTRRRVTEDVVITESLGREEISRS
ncbi:DUF2382 domain-containing protein [Frondihabitans peucedani]|uniref:DUF2382 domain-containing protein n=1 Tax=Frondihabitans peucedani TaxID=598626 RepID=A0ABP8DXI9_9MICO